MCRIRTHRPKGFSKGMYDRYPGKNDIDRAMFRKILNELGLARQEVLLHDKILHINLFGIYRIYTRKRVTKDRILKVIDWKRTIDYHKETGDRSFKIYHDKPEFNFLRFETVRNSHGRNLGYYSAYTDRSLMNKCFNCDEDSLKYNDI